MDIDPCIIILSAIGLCVGIGLIIMSFCESRRG